MNRVDPSPILFYFYFFIRSELVRVDPSWSDPDWRSELIRSDFCTCLLPILVLLVSSLAGILPIVLVLFGWRDASFGILATILACGAAGPRVAYSVDIVDCAQARHICNVLFPEPLSLPACACNKVRLDDRWRITLTKQYWNYTYCRNGPIKRQERLLHPIERKGYEVETVHINDLTEHRSLHSKDNKPRSRSPLKFF